MFSIFVCLCSSVSCRPLGDLLGTRREKMNAGAGLADIDPMAIDRSVSCDIHELMSESDSCSQLLSFIIPPLLSSSGGLWQHRRSVGSHLSSEGDGRLPASLPRSLRQLQDPAAQVYILHIYMCIYYTSSLFYTLLDQYQELSIKHHQFIDVWGQYVYFFYFVIVKDKYLFCAAAVKRLKTPELQQLNDCFD